LQNSQRQATKQELAVENLQAHRLARHPWEWRKRVLAGPHTAGIKLAAIAIAEFINRESGCAWPTWATVATSCGMSERQIRNGFAAMKAAGFFAVRRRRFQGANEVELALPADEVTGMVMPGTAKAKPARRRRGKRHDVAKATVTVMPLELTTEPSSEPLVRRASNEGATTVVGCAAAELLGYVRQDRVEGQFPDAWILSRIPDATLTELRARCAAGKLTEAALLDVLHRLNIPAVSRA
jgi:hypothetical protein